MSLDIALDAETSLVFATPILIHRPENAAAINDGLRRIILDRAARTPGVQRSNAGGWQSAPELLTWPDPEIAAYRGWIEHGVRAISRLPGRRSGAADMRLRFQAQAWANVSRDGHYNEIHSHPGNHWAAVYYVSVGTPDPNRPLNGRIELRDPRPAASFGALPGFGFGAALAVPPEAGMMIVFPAWLEHGVHPFFGQGERISIAANIAVTELSFSGAPADPTAKESAR